MRIRSTSPPLRGRSSPHFLPTPPRSTCVRTVAKLGSFVILAALVGEAAVAAFSVRPSASSVGSKPKSGAFSRAAAPPLEKDRSGEGGAFDPLEDTSRVDDSASRRGFLRSSATSVAAAAAAAAVIYADLEPADATTTETSQESSSSFAEAGGGNAVASAAGAEVDFRAIIDKSAKRALGGGKAGASAAVVQVFSLMWLRTAMNYQYRYGGDLASSLRTLTSEGGIPRLYQGLPFALLQGPLTRFGDTAANTGVLALLEAIPETAALPLPLRTAAGSVAAGLWRIVCMPLDTSKTAMQVEGADGLSRLKERVMEEGPSPLYQGALASAAATAAGHYPWFLTYNFLSDALPSTSKEDLIMTLVRSAVIGISASCVSDCISNSLRVIKTTKQTAGLGAGKERDSEGGTNDGFVVNLPKEVAEGKREMTYREALDIVLEQDGVKGLFLRGLQTRLLTNAIQGAAFSVLWKYFQTVGV